MWMTEKLVRAGGATWDLTIRRRLAAHEQTPSDQHPTDTEPPAPTSPSDPKDLTQRVFSDLS